MRRGSRPLSRRRRIALTVVLVGMALGALLYSVLVPQKVLWVNRSESMPGWLYLLHRDVVVERGAVVLVRPRGELEDLLRRKGYLPHIELLLKPVVAVAGDKVCVWDIEGVEGQTDITVINDAEVILRESWQAAAQLASWPQWRGCQVLGTDEVFLLSTHHPGSVDSRCFGPVHRDDVIGVATVLWGSK